MNQAELPQRLIRGRSCIRETKWRNRRNQKFGTLRRSIRDLNENVYDAATDLIHVRHKLHKSRNKLKEVRNEIDRLKKELTSTKKVLERNTQELRSAIDDLHLPDNRCNLTEEENIVLNMELWMAEEDAVEARNHIHDAEDDLNYELLDEDGARYFDSISLPNVMSNELIPKDGFVKMCHKCCICLQAKIDCVLYKCGHVCTCYSCTKLILADQNRDNRKCPVCRNIIKDVIRTYIV